MREVSKLITNYFIPDGRNRISPRTTLRNYLESGCLIIFLFLVELSSCFFRKGYKLAFLPVQALNLGTPLDILCERYL